MSSGEPPAEIVAALLWDVPRLKAGSPSAQDFASALSGELDRWWEPKEHSDDVLGRAAQAVARERANELEEAAALYVAVADEEDRWTRLLGLMLQAWSETKDGTASITEARGALDALDPPAELRARLLAKLVTYALDDGAVELGRELLAEAIELAPPGTRLKRALALEGLNIGLPYEWSENEPLLAPDPLVEYPWIEGESLDACRGTLAAAVEARSRRLWTFQWHIGATPVDAAASAEMQATWAGALWLRRPIRKQLGAQLLMGAARTPEQWTYGVVMWILGAGSHPQRIYSYAEPMLKNTSADFIVRTLGEAEVTPRYAHRLLSVAAEAWDALSDDVLRWVVARVPPVEGDHPQARETQRIWAGYAARLTDEWLPRFQAETLETRISLLRMLGTDTVRGFSGDARESVFETAATALDTQEGVDTQLLRVLAVAAPEPVPSTVRDDVAEKARPSGVARLAFDGHLSFLSPAVVQRARKKLIDEVQAEAEDARAGKLSFGSEDVRLSLARLVSGTPDDDSEAKGLLMRTAVDPGVPSEHLLHARNGLTLLRRAGKLDRADLRSLHNVDDPAGTYPAHGEISQQLLLVARLQILALDLRSDEVVQAVSSCRSEDAKVRQIALVTCAEAATAQRGTTDQDALAWALIGGLFDPSDEVVSSALGSLTREFLRRYEAPGRVALERLPRLFEGANVDVRSTASALAKQWAGDDKLAANPVVLGALALARNDRSWIVRNS